MATRDEFVKYDFVFFKTFAKYLNFSKSELKALERAVSMGLIQRDRLVELAISAVSGVEMDSIDGQDHKDGTDTKTVVSSIKNNHKARGSWMHSFAVRKIANKNGALRVIAYNKFIDDFHYFFIPHAAYQHCGFTVEIVAESFNGCYDRPNFTGEPKRHLKWWQYEVATFEEMCLTTPSQVRVRKNLSK